MSFRVTWISGLDQEKGKKANIQKYIRKEKDKQIAIAHRGAYYRSTGPSWSSDNFLVVCFASGLLKC